MTKNNNYDKIALQAVMNILKPKGGVVLVDEFYNVAYEAAKLQAENWNENLDNNYIESLEEEEDLW